MRTKWKTYKLERVLEKYPPEQKVETYDFVGRWNRDARMTLTVAGYKAIMAKDGRHLRTYGNISKGDK